MDFSASDARSLRPRGSRRGIPGSRRSYGGITGLGDVPLLPPLFSDGESRRNVELLCLTALACCKQTGVRPIGLNSDNLADWFDTFACCFDASFPGLVKYLAMDSPQAQSHVETGGVVVDKSSMAVAGLELGQDLPCLFFGTCFSFPKLGRGGGVVDDGWRGGQKQMGCGRRPKNKPPGCLTRV